MAKETTIKQVNSEGEFESLKLWFDPNIPKDRTWRFSGDISEENTAESVRVYPIEEKEEDSDFFEHPVFGKCLKYDNSRKFSFRYTNPELEFSTASFFKYWHEVCCNLEFNTNVITVRNQRKVEIIQEIADFTRICSCNRTTAFTFVRECMRRGYIARFELRGKTMFVTSPEQTRNGSGLPITLWHLFKFGQEYLDSKGVILEEKMVQIDSLDDEQNDQQAELECQSILLNNN